MPLRAVRAEASIILTPALANSSEAVAESVDIASTTQLTATVLFVFETSFPASSMILMLVFTDTVAIGLVPRHRIALVVLMRLMACLAGDFFKDEENAIVAMEPKRANLKLPRT